MMKTDLGFDRITVQATTTLRSEPSNGTRPTARETVRGADVRPDPAEAAFTVAIRKDRRANVSAFMGTSPASVAGQVTKGPPPYRCGPSRLSRSPPRSPYGLAPPFAATASGYSTRFISPPATCTKPRTLITAIRSMFSTGPTTAGSQRRDRWRPELAGSGASLRSQGAVVLDGELLFAVNSGSATVSALQITAHGLFPRDTVPTRGSLPVSVPSSSLALVLR
jgi:hypothetical protein